MLKQINSSFYQTFLSVIELEADSLLKLKQFVTNEQISELVKIYELLLGTGGQLVFSGVGKSGIVAQKLASTFSSLGLSSFFLHPVEALHGDLGRVSSIDAIVFLSKSGNTEEIVKLIPHLSIPKEMIIGILGNPKGSLGELCGLVLNSWVEKEACLNDLAPTTSTTAMMAIGDAMAITYQHLVGLSKENFLRYHPGGLLGKALRLKVRDVMIPKKLCALVKITSSLGEGIEEMTRNPMGIAAVLNEDLSTLAGILVEGDMRRLFSRGELNADRLIEEVMNKNPLVVEPSALALDALKIMELREKQISVLPVVEKGEFLGIVRLHDLLREGLSASA